MTYFCRRISFKFKGIIGYRRYMKFIYDLEVDTIHPEVRQRLKALIFCGEYGLAPTLKAFEISRSTFFRWQRLFLASGRSPVSLINRSQRPHNVRRMEYDEKVYLFIKRLREEYPRLGKQKIKLLLDEYCLKESLGTLSVSKIGRMIKRNNWFLYLGQRRKRAVSVDRQRVFGYQVAKIGDLLQLDAIVRFERGIKRYLLTAIEVKSKFAFAYSYPTLSSKVAADFIGKLIRISPFEIKAIQTDNGSEFLKLADEAMKKQGIVHFFSYPHCPKQNAVIERFNRTLQEEMVEANRLLLETDLNLFNQKLIDYLLFYDTKRPHQSLNYKVPMKMIVDEVSLSGEKSNMSWTSTRG